MLHKTWSGNILIQCNFPNLFAFIFVIADCVVFCSDRCRHCCQFSIFIFFFFVLYSRGERVCVEYKSICIFSCAKTVFPGYTNTKRPSGTSAAATRRFNAFSNTNNLFASGVSVQQHYQRLISSCGVRSVDVDLLTSHDPQLILAGPQGLLHNFFSVKFHRILLVNVSNILGI